MLQILNLLFALIMIRQQLPNEFFFALLERNVVRISAQDVLEQTLELVDIVVFLSSEIESSHFLVLG